jgi:hypothetical protein
MVSIDGSSQCFGQQLQMTALVDGCEIAPIQREDSLDLM